MPPSPCPRVPSCCRSHLYEVDQLERQIRELELENRKLRRVQAGRIGGGPGAPFSPETSAAYNALEQGPHQRALAEEVARLRSENRSLEVEGIAFQQRMEAAINTFEEQLEQTAHDKELMSSELEEARKALADANAAKAAAEKVARQAQRQQAAGVAATDELQQQHSQELTELTRERDDAIASARMLRAEQLEARAAHERELRKLQDELRRNADVTTRSRDEFDEIRANERAAREAHEQLLREKEVVEQRLAECAVQLTRAEREREQALTQREQALASAAAQTERFAAAAQSAAARAQAQQEAKLAHARAEADEELVSVRAQTARAVAAAKAEAQAALAAADEELVSVRAQLEASRAAAKVAAESAAAAAAAQKSATAAEALTNGEAGRAKVETLSRMLREQQAELTDGYRLSAYGKLAAAMDKRVVLSLATALAQWRGKNDLISIGEEHTAALVDLRSSSTVATGASIAALQIETTRLSSELSHATQAAMAQARGHRAQLEATEAALAVAKAEAHAAKVAADTGLAHMRARLETAQTAVGATAAEALTNGEAGRAKVAGLSRMLREQQAELTDGYRLFASIKVASAVEKRLVVSLATAWARWRLIHEFT